MLDNINTPKLRAVFYGLIVISSLAVFGNVAELCDIADACPSRLVATIAIGVLTTIVGGILFVGSLFQVNVVVSLEFLLSTLLLVSFSVCVGVASSFRTNIQETIALSFSWVGLALSFVAMFLTLTTEGGILRSGKDTTPTWRSKSMLRRKRRDVEAGEEVPEHHYMEQIGEVNKESMEGQANEECKDEPMVSIEESKESWVS